LHQFRGRVGRGKYQSYCFLFSETLDEKISERLSFLANCGDGFRLAEYDLKMRGSGSFYGIEQSGFVSGLKLADVNDVDLIKQTNEAVRNFLFSNNIEDHPELNRRLKLRDAVFHLE
jgi:ATP-dependent DNA helicase RecG